MSSSATGALMGLVAVAIGVSLSPAPGNSLWNTVLHDVAHVLVFIPFGWWFSSVWEWLAAPAMPAGWQRLLGCVLLSALVGAGTELVQSLTGSGYFTWSDVLRDTFGAVIGAAWWTGWHTSLASRRALVWAGATLGTLAGIWPLASAKAVYGQREAQFPDFLPPAAAVRWPFVDSQGDDLRFVAAGTAGQPSQAAVLPLTGGRWPGLRVTEPVADWRGYRALSVELVNPSDRALSLVIRVHDVHHDGSVGDRFNREIELAPGERRRLSWPLAGLKTDSGRRALDLGQVEALAIFHDGEVKGGSFEVVRLWLEH